MCMCDVLMHLCLWIKHNNIMLFAECWLFLFELQIFNSPRIAESHKFALDSAHIRVPGFGIVGIDIVRVHQRSVKNTRGFDIWGVIKNANSKYRRMETKGCRWKPQTDERWPLRAPIWRYWLSSSETGTSCLARRLSPILTTAPHKRNIICTPLPCVLSPANCTRLDAVPRPPTQPTLTS